MKYKVELLIETGDVEVNPARWDWRFLIGIDDSDTQVDVWSVKETILED